MNRSESVPAVTEPRSPRTRHEVAELEQGCPDFEPDAARISVRRSYPAPKSEQPRDEPGDAPRSRGRKARRCRIDEDDRKQRQRAGETGETKATIRLTER